MKCLAAWAGDKIAFIRAGWAQMEAMLRLDIALALGVDAQHRNRPLIMASGRSRANRHVLCGLGI